MTYVGTLVSAGQDIAEGDYSLMDAVGDVGGLGMEMLGAVLDPIGALIAAPLAELAVMFIKHIKFISEPLEKLAGSEALVTAQSEAWVAVSQQYADAAQDLAAGVNDMPTWEGSAAEAYAPLLEATVGLMEQCAGAAQKMAIGVELMGTLVGMVRDFIWSIIQSLIQMGISSALTALATAIPTFGASLAAFATWFTARVGAVALKIAQFIERLLKKAAKVFKKFDKIRKLLYKAINKIQKYQKKIKAAQRTTATALKLAEQGKMNARKFERLFDMKNDNIFNAASPEERAKRIRDLINGTLTSTGQGGAKQVPGDVMT